MLTNFFRIELSFQDFQIQRVPYSEKQLHSFREQYNPVCSFFRNGDWIYISPALGSDLSLGSTATLKVEKEPDVVGSAIRHLLFRVFREQLPERLPLDFRPLRFYAKQDEKNFLPESIRDEIAFRRVIEVHVRTVLGQSTQTEFGILINSHRKWQLSANLAALVGAGFDPVGMAVLEVVPVEGLGGILAPDESVLGEIVEVSDGRARIKSNEGDISRPLTSLFLQRNYRQIAKYLVFRLGEKAASALMSQARSEHQESLKPGRQYGDVRKFAAWFSRQTYQNNDGFSFKVTSDNEITTHGFSLERTRLHFGFTPGEVASYPLGGLEKFGPCDSAKFDKKTPNILVLFHERNRGAATAFVGKLISGIPGNRYFGKGFKDLFRLHDVKTTSVSIKSQFAEDYEEAIDKAVKAAQPAFDIAIIDCDDDSKDIPIAHNPYLRAKARLMSYGIPMQGIKTTHLRSASDKLSYTLGPTSLQMYAKIGGIPWVLPAAHTVDHELVVGIGSSIHRPNFWTGAAQSRVVGLTTFFLGDGTYVLGQEISSVPYTEYLTALTESLERSLKEVSKMYWREGTAVRIVFHVFKPLRDIEISAVNQVVKRFPENQILFAFVNIHQEHPWLMFSSARESNQRWEVQPCERGQNLVISETECLLQLQGAKDRPNKKHGMASPVLIRLHELSTFRDLHYIAQQVQDFSFMCWRSFFPVYTPVTLLYANNIARISSQLAQLPNWNPVVIDSHFRRKQWFL